MRKTVETALQCDNVCRQYQSGGQLQQALRNVTVSVESGEMLCLTGPSGSGKTSLLNVIGALDRQDSGSVRIGGRDIQGLSKAERARLRLFDIGFVFQAYNLVPVLSAVENVEFVMQVQGVAASVRRRRAEAMLARVGLQGLEHRRPGELSGGQQQRVAVARALVGEPVLVLADEPTANLDSVSAAELMTLIAELNRESGTTFIIATHDERVVAHCRRRLRMEDGAIVGDEIPELIAGGQSGA